MTAALFLMTALHLHALADGFPISHFRLREHHFRTEFPLQLFRQNFQMDFANAFDQCFSGFLLFLHHQRRVFVLLLDQGAEDLVFLALLLGRYRHFQHGLRIADAFILNGIALIAKGIAGTHLLQLRRDHDIAGSCLTEIFLTLALHGKECTDAFLAVLIDMEVVGIALHFAGQDADKALPAHKGVNGGLKDLRRERIFRAAFLDFSADGVCTDGHLEIRRGHIFHQAIHQLTDTDILFCRSTEHGENLAGLNAFNHGSCHFYFGDFLTFDVFFQ